jgi:H+/gluconate symporter-like permease
METFKTYSVVATLMSVVGLAVVLVMSVVFPLV